MLQFEWDSDKAKANLAKHGVSFEEARLAFDDPFAVELIDDRFEYDEERIIRIGLAGHRLLTIVYVERDERTRLISAWPATRMETDEYLEAQGGP